MRCRHVRTVYGRDNERGPDEDFKLRFEALNKLDPDERIVIKELIDGMLLKHQARRLAARPEMPQAAVASQKMTTTARKVATKAAKKSKKESDSETS